MRSGAENDAAAGKHSPWIPASPVRVDAAAACCAAAFFMDLGYALVATAMPWLAVDQFHVGGRVIGGISSGGTVLYTVVALAAGPLGRRFGSARRSLAGSVVTALAFGACAGVRGVWGLALLFAISFTGLAIYWPALQTLLMGDAESEALPRQVMRFNLAWSVGMMAGPLAAGVLYHYSARLPFVLAAMSAGLAVICTGAAFRLRMKESAGAGAFTESTRETIGGRRGPALEISAFLFAAWCGNFASYYCTANIRNFFPLLASFQHIKVPVQGAILFSVSALQTLTFLALHQWQGWQRRWSAFLGAITLLAGGMVLTAVTGTILMHVAAFAITGVGFGITYSLSLYHSLHSGEGARNAGIHEANIGAAGLCGALSGGFIGHAWGLQAPFFASAAVVTLAGIGIVAILRTRS